jgi:5-(carboxyamino)imidazole ribonucleotide synthase
MPPVLDGASVLDGPLAPGAVIGILGGGQLGRMSALAAARLGYRCHIYCPQPEAPAAQVTDLATVAAYDDEAALARFAAAVDVVTFEFENIPFTTVETLSALVALRPKAEVLRICQDRLLEKDFCNLLDIPTAPYATVGSFDDLSRAVAEIGRPCVLKTTRLGYDGKGQALIEAESDLEAAWPALTGHGPGGLGMIVETFVDFALEVSVIVARAADGTTQSYVPVENEHRNHILDRTLVPARIAPEVAEHADAIACRLAEPDRFARGRDVRDERRRRPGERAGAAAAQLRPLDHRRLRHLAVRAVHSRGGGASAGRDGPPRGRRDEKSVGR